MGVINVLEPQVANLIAAGEVVDRPASVVKELLENAIDAGSTQVTVEIKNGGITFLRVTDNGKGMSKEDVPICIRRHATSKIKDQGDLDGIMTLGFRGEALAAIGAVSTLRILTKQRGTPMGTQLTCAGGDIVEITECGCIDGTTVIVESLFENIPARRKFLKRDASEAMAVAAVVEKIALSRPDLAIKFISNGVLKFDTAGDGDLKSCVYAVLGREFATKMTEVHGMTGGIEVVGYIGMPTNIKANRNYQNFFINGRYVKSRTAMAAIEQAYSSYIPHDKFPVCVLEIKIHPALVDVNVHPSKLEVKFSNEQAVFDAVYSAVRTTLTAKLNRPEFTMKTREEARKEARIISAFVPLKDGSGITYGKGEQMKIVDPPKPLSESKIPEKDNIKPEDLPPHLRYLNTEDKKDEERQDIPYAFDASVNNDIPSSNENIQGEDDEDKIPENIDLTLRKPEEKAEIVEEYEREKTLSALPKTEVFVETEEKESEKTEIVQPVKEVMQTEYSISKIPRKSAVEEIVNVPEYRILGDAFNAYIIVELEGKLMMIDQHAAHERILFEDMRKNIQNGADSQIILMPIEINLNPSEVAAVNEYAEEIKATGFDFMISENKVSLIAIPSSLDGSQSETLFSTIAGQIAMGTGSIETTHKKFYEKALYQASCKAAIKAGRLYNEAHIDWITRRVISDPAIRFCPHGRPVAYELTKNEIEHWFQRK